MWLEFIIEGLKNFAGEIIGVLLITFVLSMFPELRKLFTKYKKLKEDNADDTDIHIQRVLLAENERIQADLRRKEEALRQAEVKKTEEAKRRTEVQKQLEAQREEQEHIKAEFQRKEKLSQEEARKIIVIGDLRKSKIKKQNVDSQQKFNDNDFIKLCMLGGTLKVETAIINGANVNAKDKDGKTALMHAIGMGHTDIVALLLKHGADIDAKEDFKDDESYTVLMQAELLVGHTETAELLLKHGIHLNDYALCYAAKKGFTETVELLLKHGTNVNAKNKYCKTALMCAVEYTLSNTDRYPNTVALLLKHGADVNAKDDEGKTALMYAVKYTIWNTYTVELLLKHGADVNAKDNKGKTALMYATDDTYLTKTEIVVVELLSKHGADINAKDDEGKTALILAKMNGNMEAANILRKYGAK